MSTNQNSERAVLGSGLLALGGALAGLAAILGARAVDHIAASADMCIPGASHCPACVIALICFAAGLVAGGSGLSLLRPLEAPLSRATASGARRDNRRNR